MARSGRPGGSQASCPHCGGTFRFGRLACPHCGSDFETGWNPYLDEDTSGVVPDSFDDDSYAEVLADLGLDDDGRPSDRPRPMTPRQTRNLVIGLLVVASMLGLWGLLAR